MQTNRAGGKSSRPAQSKQARKTAGDITSTTSPARRLTKRVKVWMPKAMKAAVVKAARSLGISRAAYVRLAIAQRIETVKLQPPGVKCGAR